MALSLFATVGGSEMIRLVTDTGVVAKIVLAILLAFSVFSWAVIFAKWSRFRQARTQSDRFLRAFRRSRKLSDLDAISQQFRPSPLVALFE